MMKFSFKDFETLGSTNAYLMEIPENERVGIVVSTQDQTRGKGMGTNVWESQAGKNLTFSLGADLSFLQAADQFLLSEAVPLGLLDVLDTVLSPEKLMVKWPNDLLYEKTALNAFDDICIFPEWYKHRMRLAPLTVNERKPQHDSYIY